MKDINFFEPYKNNKDEEEKIYYSLLIALMSFIIILTSSINIVKIVFLKDEISHYKTLLSSEELKEQVKISKEVNRKLDALTKYEKDLVIVDNEMKEKDVVSNTLLNNISTTLPKTVDINSMRISKRSISIQATAKSRKSISEFQHNLKSLQEIDSVYVKNIDENEAIEDQYTFSIECYINENIVQINNNDAIEQENNISNNQENSNIVYWVENGEKYHKVSYCSDMKNPISGSIEESNLSQKRDACKKCY